MGGLKGLRRGGLKVLQKRGEGGGLNDLVGGADNAD